MRQAIKRIAVTTISEEIELYEIASEVLDFSKCNDDNGNQ